MSDSSAYWPQTSIHVPDVTHCIFKIPNVPTHTCSTLSPDWKFGGVFGLGASLTLMTNVHILT